MRCFHSSTIKKFRQLKWVSIIITQRCQFLWLYLKTYICRSRTKVKIYRTLLTNFIHYVSVNSFSLYSNLPSWILFCFQPWTEILTSTYFVFKTMCCGGRKKWGISVFLEDYVRVTSLRNLSLCSSVSLMLSIAKLSRRHSASHSRRLCCYDERYRDENDT